MRFVPHTDGDRRAMLETIGAESIEALFAPIPKHLRAPEALDFPARLSEPELLRHMAELAAKNRPVTGRPSFLGAGCSRHYIPPIIDALVSRGEFLTAYTPYQAEASQGTLQAIYEFQSMVAELAGLDAANASMYDGATALCEAALMLHGSRGGEGRRRLVLSKGIHPEYRETVKTYLAYLGVEVLELDLDAAGQTPVDAVREACEDAFAFALASPSFVGTIERAAELFEAAHAAGAQCIQVFHPIAAALLLAPGEAGADVAVAEGQGLGTPPQLGGPHLGLFSATKDHLRRMPGRIVGKTKDLEGRPAYVLTLQTREQHIRREKATSNICTNVGLIALRAAIYLATLGKNGLREVATICLERAHHLGRAVAAIPGYALRYPETPFFHELAVTCPRPAAEVNRALLARGIVGGFDLGRVDPSEARTMLLCVTELQSPADIEALLTALTEIGGAE